VKKIPSRNKWSGNPRRRNFPCRQAVISGSCSTVKNDERVLAVQKIELEGNQSLSFDYSRCGYHTTCRENASYPSLPNLHSISLYSFGKEFVNLFFLSYLFIFPTWALFSPFEISSFGVMIGQGSLRLRALAEALEKDFSA
jgi:hypothetical protein